LLELAILNEFATEQQKLVVYPLSSIYC